MPAILEWTAAVRQHVPGQSDKALSTITEWTYDDIDKMRPLLEKLVDAPAKNDYERGRRFSRLSPRDMEAIREALKARGTMDPDLFRRRAAVLHTDAALLGPPPLDTQSYRIGRRVNINSFDGRFENLQYSNPHWDLAMDMLDALAASPRDPFVGQWYAAIGTHLVQRRQFADALVHFDRARQLVATDPRVLYSEARLHETLGSPRIQSFVRVTALANGLSIQRVAPTRTEMRRAEELLRHALEGAPSFVAARLRLGRVVMRQQRWDEGLRHMEHVLNNTQDKTLSYYANLFAGDAELALGNADDAQRSYERALTLFPASQSARLGLAAALGGAGEREESVTAILPTLTRNPEGRADDDPWWIYYDGNLAEADAELDRLRASFKEAGR